jgi:putative toxin-antitoxin system antitoxin component (TIGR02293 family)
MAKQTQKSSMHSAPVWEALLIGDPVASYGAPAPQIPFGLARDFTQNYALTVRDFADILEVTPKTLHRWSAKDEDLSVQQTDRLRILASILKLGESVLGSRERVSRWLREPVLDLNSRPPLELLKTESGRREVENLLHRIEWGIY